MCKMCNTDREPYMGFSKPQSRVYKDYEYESVYPTVQKKTHIRTKIVKYEVTTNRIKGISSMTFSEKEEAIAFAKSIGVKKKTSLAEIFSNAVYDYTGERPCKKCCNNISAETYMKNGIDFMIIKRLFNISTKGRRKETKTQSDSLRAKTNIVVQKNIAKNIQLNIVNGKIFFKVVFKIKGEYNGKTFSDINDALAYRDSMESKREVRKKGKITKKRICKNISLETNSETNRESFLVIIHTLGKYRSGSFKTLADAKKWRDEKTLERIKTRTEKVKTYKVKVSKNIYKVTNTHINRIYFMLRISKNKKVKQYSFDTLQEAIHYRDKILIGEIR